MAVISGNTVRYGDADWMTQYILDGDDEPADVDTAWESDPPTIWKVT